jgi:catechol 2,3-dioxygenase-like lactoylglutathione lyase family enzyme
MFSHVMVGVNDLEVSRKFYDAVLGTLGVPPGAPNKNRYFYRSPTGTFAISTPINGEPAFHAAGVAHGGVSCEEPPGYREGPTGRLYLAYLRDPNGNKLCVLHRPPKPAAAQ